VVDRGGAEIPDDRLVVAGEKSEAAELVALPFADLGAGDVADVVDVEEEKRAALGVLQGLAGAGEPVGAQPVEIDPALEIDRHMAGRAQMTSPIPVRIERTRRYFDRLGPGLHQLDQKCLLNFFRRPMILDRAL
jgi:hypothetical protein